MITLVRKKNYHRTCARSLYLCRADCCCEEGATTMPLPGTGLVSSAFGCSVIFSLLRKSPVAAFKSQYARMSHAPPGTSEYVMVSSFERIVTAPLGSFSRTVTFKRNTRFHATTQNSALL